MSSKQHGRRRFLRESGAVLAGLAVGGGRAAQGQQRESAVPDELTYQRSYGVRSPFESIARENVPGQAQFLLSELTPLQDLVGIITPSALHFQQTRFHDYPPSIDPQKHRLLIHGLVDRPLMFTLEELKRFPSVSRIHFLECHGNSNWPGGFHNGFRTPQQSHGKTSCSEWTGVLVSTLLREAGVKKEGTWILAEAADAGKHPRCIPMAAAMDDCLVAYGQNGEAVRPEQGYPIRLVVPGVAGVNNVKYLRRIKVVDEVYMFRWSYGGRFQNREGHTVWVDYIAALKSVITRRAGGQRLSGPGFYEITGLAWSGKGTIRKVEVSTDIGRTWKEAKLHDPVLPKAHTRFTFPWVWDGAETVIQSRCTDDQGDVQPSLIEFAKIRGFPPGEPLKIGGITTDFFKIPTTGTTIQPMVNAIQPWKVTREGSVENALLA